MMPERVFSIGRALHPHGGDSGRGTVLMLPGFGYACRLSLLAWTTRALQCDGWTVLQAEWAASDVPDERRAFIEDVAARLDAVDRRPGPVLVVAKSLGTLAAHWAARQKYPAVWLTPVFQSAGLRPMPEHSTALVERIRHYPAANLVVGGTVDPLWQKGFSGTGQVLEIEGVDHGIEHPTWRRSIREHERVAAAVSDFAADLPNP